MDRTKSSKAITSLCRSGKISKSYSLAEKKDSEDNLDARLNFSIYRRKAYL